MGLTGERAEIYKSKGYEKARRIISEKIGA